MVAEADQLSEPSQTADQDITGFFEVFEDVALPVDSSDTEPSANPLLIEVNSSLHLHMDIVDSIDSAVF